MPTHVALLRGINVGGRAKVAMADLREIVEGLGHTEVATYVNSGNVVFKPGSRAGTAKLASALEAAIEQRLGIRPLVYVLTRDQLAAVVDANPYSGESNPKHVHVAFGAEPARKALDDALVKAAEKGSADEATVTAGVLWLHTPNGLGRSKLAELLSRGAAKQGTMRNWSTVTKLLALLADEGV